MSDTEITNPDLIDQEESLDGQETVGLDQPQDPKAAQVEQATGGLDDVDFRDISLISKEGTKYPISTECIVDSTLLKTIVGEDATATEYQCPEASDIDLKRCVEYMNHIYKDSPVYDKTTKDPTKTSHRTVQKPISSNDVQNLTECDWCTQFVNLPQEELCSLLSIANYMAIQPLVDLVCTKITSMMFGCTAEEIRTKFGIVNDFTPEEMKKLEEETAWANSTL